MLQLYEVTDIEDLWEKYIEDHREFCREGDERDESPCWEEMTPSIMIPEAQKRFNEFKKEAAAIENAAEYHRRQMQCHGSGSEYHRALADYQELIGM